MPRRAYQQVGAADDGLRVILPADEMNPFGNLQLAGKGGERLALETEGYYLSPALFTGTRNDMRVNREEMFAPIACVIEAGDYGEALALANDPARRPQDAGAFYHRLAPLVSQARASEEDLMRRIACDLVSSNTERPAPFFV